MSFSIPLARIGGREAQDEMRPVANERRLLRLKAGAEYLSISPAKLRHLIDAGEIPYISYGEGTSPWLVDIKDLDNWITRNKQTVQ